jgi:hypothetical protein
MASPKIHVAVRLDPEHVAQLDTLIPAISTPWHRATRSDALRALVIRGLKTLPADPGGIGDLGGGADPSVGTTR